VGLSLIETASPPFLVTLDITPITTIHEVAVVSATFHAWPGPRDHEDDMARHGRSM
jgi:hypothetical protein